MVLILGNATNKFQRTYQIQIGDRYGNTYSIGSGDANPSLTMEFVTTRAVMASAQSATFRIKNIPADIRNQIGKDWFDTGIQVPLIVKAGYVGTPLSTIFNGIVLSTLSYREEGGVDYITEIEGHDFSVVMSNCFSKWTIGSVAQPTNQTQVIQRLISDMQIYSSKKGINLGIGYVGSFTDNRYSYTANEHTWDLIQTETGRLTYIDNGKIYCLPNDEIFEGDVSLISSETGLLGTPRRSQSQLSVELIFEPSLIPGQLTYLQTNLDSRLNSSNNSTYKVISVQHAGIISPTVNGKCKTTALLQLFGTNFSGNFGL